MWYENKNCKSIFSDKLMIFFSNHKIWNIWKSIIDPSWSISQKFSTAMTSVIVDLLYFANGFLKLLISNDKCHLNLIFLNGVFYFVYNECCCILS